MNKNYFNIKNNNLIYITNTIVTIRNMVNAMIQGKTTIQINESTRDRLYRLKFRRTYDQFLNELCNMYEEAEKTVNFEAEKID
jgi:hypothetical protein